MIILWHDLQNVSKVKKSKINQKTRKTNKTTNMTKIKKKYFIKNCCCNSRMQPYVFFKCSASIFQLFMIFFFFYQTLRINRIRNGNSSILSNHHRHSNNHLTHVLLVYVVSCLIDLKVFNVNFSSIFLCNFYDMAIIKM